MMGEFTEVIGSPWAHRNVEPRRCPCVLDPSMPAGCPVEAHGHRCRTSLYVLGTVLGIPGHSPTLEWVRRTVWFLRPYQMPCLRVVAEFLQFHRRHASLFVQDVRRDIEHVSHDSHRCLPVLCTVSVFHGSHVWCKSHCMYGEPHHGTARYGANWHAQRRTRAPAYIHEPMMVEQYVDGGDVDATARFINMYVLY